MCVGLPLEQGQLSEGLFAVSRVTVVRTTVNKRRNKCTYRWLQLPASDKLNSNYILKFTYTSVSYNANHDVIQGVKYIIYVGASGKKLWEKGAQLFRTIFMF